jgi:M6 family metalloprotease-like protein
VANSANQNATESIKGLVVLIDFADRNAYFTPAEVDDFFNQRGYTRFGNNGSVRDYWYAVSQGRVDVQTIVTTAYYKAPKTFAYYDTDGGGGHTHELLDSALNWLDKTGFDFSQLTVDANKNIKALSFQFVGNSGAKGLWGHSSSHVRTFDGVRTASYQISELGTSEMRLGGICHEQGHMLFGWPDTYDIDGTNGGSSGCGKFDLMAAGNSNSKGEPSQNPMPPNPYFRYQKGWNDMIPLNGMPNDTTLKIIANSWNTYVYRNPDRPGEMYIIEARRKPYRNVDMPGEGVLVWHIDSVIPNNANQHRTEQKHYKVSVVQADNAFHLESGANSGDVNDYFKAGILSNVTYNHTRWWNSAFSGLQLRNISAVADTMTAKYGSSNASDVAIKSGRTLGGTVNPFGLRYYTLNNNQTFTATPTRGFSVYDCVVDNESKGPVTQHTFSNIDRAHSINFSFIHNAVPLKNIVSSVNYSYYEGTWKSLPDFSKLTPVRSGTLSTVTLAIPGRISNDFGVVYTGYINVPATDEYTFYLTADDGARFMIDGVEIVANQCEPEKSGVIRLEAGYHPFTIEFFEIQVTESMYLRWSSPNMTKRSLSGFVNGVVDYTALEDLSALRNARLWADKENIRISADDTDLVVVEIYSLSGVMLDRKELALTQGIASMSHTHLPVGVYAVRAFAGNKILIREKICIVR